MIERVFRIEVDGGEVAAVLTRPESCRPGVTPGVVLAHGANNDLNHPLLVAVAAHLAEIGVASVLRFNFPYMERGSSTPDASAVLEAAFRRAHDALVDDDVCPPGRVFLGGKSLGARVAAELVSRHHEGEGLLAAGLVFLGYPLHAPGRKDRLKTEPLRRIDVPSLFLEGTHDPFCDLDLLRPVIAALDVPGTLHAIEGGGHSFEVPRSSARTPENVQGEVVGVVARFITEHAG
jgi:predicted alpha/beta-hydrolase family hydrolase